MVISRYNNCFYVEQDYIYFLDLTFRHYGQGSSPKVIYLNNANDNLVRGCTFANNDLGIGIKRYSNRNVIEENVFYDVIFDWSWADVKDVGGLEDGGITFYDPVNGRGNIVRRNTFHDDFDGFGACPASAPEVATNETDVYQNLVYNMGDDGMETDGQSSNVRIWGNVFHDVLMGISLAPAYTGPTYAIRNLVYRTGVGNHDYTGSPFKFNSGYGQSGPMYLFHNTADAALPGNNGLYVKAPGTWQLIYARNNIWAGTAYALENYNTGQPIDLDHDDVYNAGAGDLVRWDGTRYATLGAFSSATGQENAGVNVAPGFRDAPGGDYRLTAASALIDAGQVVSGINSDFRGAAPDIGAFETSPPPGGVNLLLLN
jgi:parallel beta-helix repeat protein